MWASFACPSNWSEDQVGAAVLCGAVPGAVVLVLAMPGAASVALWVGGRGGLRAGSWFGGVSFTAKISGRRAATVPREHDDLASEQVRLAGRIDTEYQYQQSLGTGTPDVNYRDQKSSNFVASPSFTGKRCENAGVEPLLPVIRADIPRLAPKTLAPCRRGTTPKAAQIVPHTTIFRGRGSAVW